MRPDKLALIAILACPKIMEYKPTVLYLRRFCLIENYFISSLKIFVLTTLSVSSGFIWIGALGVIKLLKCESKSAVDLKVFCT